jgi:transposase
LLPPSVRDELGANHLCFFVRGIVERLDMTVFEQSYSVEGGELYAPQLMLGVWLYAYALGITSARQVGRWNGAWLRILRFAIWPAASEWTTGL